jgi:hypothetical protein
VYKTTDFGQTWTSLSSGLPEVGYLHVVREDPVNPDLLYAGSEFGLFLSFDAGRTWLPYRKEFPTVAVRDMIGVYLWIQPQTRQQFLRIIYAADFVDIDEQLALDKVIVARHWLTRGDLEAYRPRHRSPSVMRCVEDFEAGRRESHALISGMLPLEHNVERVLARADLL